MKTSTIAVLGVAAFFLMSRSGSGPAGASGMILLPNGNRITPDGTVYSPTGQVIGHGTPVDYARAVALRGRSTGQNPATTLALVKSITGLVPAVYSALGKMLSGVTGTLTDQEIAALRDQGLTTDLSVAMSSGDVTGGNMADADIAALRDAGLTGDTTVTPDPGFLDQSWFTSWEQASAPDTSWAEF